MRYLALGIAQKCDTKARSRIKDIFHADCKAIRDWSNQAEMITKRRAIFAALNKFLLAFESFQQPLLLQPIWKTKGKEPKLAENCLDVFTWTDFALARMLYDVATSAKSDNAITAIITFYSLSDQSTSDSKLIYIANNYSLLF